MSSTRLFERIADYRKALARLHQALALTETDLVPDATIQRFEFTFEMAWKVMKLYLEFKGIDVRNPKDALREGLAQGLIVDGNGWTELQEQRNLTSHTYDEGVAKGVFAFLKSKGAALFDGFEAEIVKRTQRGAP